MPTYVYKCRECTEQFELNRPMSASADPASCPDGHADTVKLLTTVGVSRGGAAPAPSGGGGGGGCCGGGCCG
ncbi:zinc ribbon domain-containing protein [Solihabitans fulvus]|uniref:Zinc ribbon domain-containing protein n=1 Tax=Solihabitans fulvus TaxID=1892852 RepID=A0A5B2X8T4_9PSEU|nr:zinc ribbon domain-containing protein [Solihabitans fulvus]KAA2259459.1 zinc ribbon domain-containing protein [Solihabitans fulvus]